MTSATWWIGRLAATLGCLALLQCLSVLFGDSSSPGRLLALKYCSGLDARLRFIRSRVRGYQVFIAQHAATAGLLGLALAARAWLLLLLTPILWVGPKLRLDMLATRRVARIDDQVETWLNALANALKASPSLGEAIGSTVSLVPPPLSQELELLVKEHELGTPLDEALDNLARRVDTRALSGTVTALKIARRSGGNLVEMLETAAASLREFARLEGVVRTKTAEGKAQAVVIGLVPFPLVLGIRAIDPVFFDPLLNSVLGQAIIAGAVLLWLAAILLARRILAVDV